MSWSRADKLALLGVLVAIFAAIVGVLSLPQDSWVRSLFHSQPDYRPPSKPDASVSSEPPTPPREANLWTPSDETERAIAETLATLDAVAETCGGVSPQLVGATESQFREKLNVKHLTEIPRIRKSQVYLEAYEINLSAAKAQMIDFRDCTRMLNLVLVVGPFDK